jgi:hypothetical protein
MYYIGSVDHRNSLSICSAMAEMKDCTTHVSLATFYASSLPFLGISRPLPCLPLAILPGERMEAEHLL